MEVNDYICIKIVLSGKIMTTLELGNIIRERRKSLKLTQAEVAMASGIGGRFISDLENGKETCQIGKTLMVINSLGIDIAFNER